MAFRLSILLLSFHGTRNVATAFSASNTNYNPSLAEAGTTKNVATQILQGVGPCQTEDLQKYNLESVDRIVAEWTATLVQKAAESKSKLKLGCKSANELYVDSFDLVVDRVGNGIGVILQEIAGGRSDGLGITVVTESTSSLPDLLPGDSIAKVSLVRKTKQSTLEDKEEILSVATECLGYDATVQAIQSLPIHVLDDSYTESWRLTVKRIRRKPIVTVKLKYPPSSTSVPGKDEPPKEVSLELFAGENLRQALLTRGYSVNDSLSQRFDGKGIQSGNCGAGGLCRTCAVAVETGADVLNPPRIAEHTMFANAPRMRLACKTIVGYGMREGTLRVRVYPNQW